jgi:glycopeptide antibiotics resistance protein
VLASGSLPALGKIPVQGSLALRIKYFITQARPLLHVLLLFAPSLALAWLVGRRPALFIASTLALAIELAQVAFGYGFDGMDALDLACDASGIALAIWVHKKMLKPKKLKS